MSTPKRRTSAGRNPARTRERILAAALREFAAHGFAGARVDAIAKRAGSNKRMLYHYFEDKEGLSRAVLRHKIKDRMNRVESQAPQNDVVSSLPMWFKQNCQDADWVRLLAWESLQAKNDKVVDEEERLRLSGKAAKHIKQSQAHGFLRNDVAATHLLLAKISLAMFPMALPQIARLITGRAPTDPKFQREYTQFLETISDGFRP